MDITIRDNGITEKIYNDVVRIFEESGLDYFTVLGILECIKQDIMEGMISDD